MALLVRGRTVCVLCGLVISADDDAVIFPPMTANTLDPVFRYSDAACHATCVDSACDGWQARERMAELLSANAPSNRRCEVCGELIRDPDDYLGIGYLTFDESLLASRFNFVHLHLSHVHAWSRLGEAIEALRQLSSSGTFVPTDAVDALEDQLLEHDW
jgi:hypothetical protein